MEVSSQRDALILTQHELDSGVPEMNFHNVLLKF